MRAAALAARGYNCPAPAGRDGGRAAISSPIGYTELRPIDGRAQVNLSAGEREDRANRWVIAAFGVLGLALAIAPAYADRIGLLVFGGEGLRWIGVVFYAVGGVLRLVPIFALGERFSGLAAIQPGHRLKTDGLYAVVRNPSYLGLLVLSLGWGLAFRSLVGVAIAALFAIPLHARMNAEERLLAEKFGAEYEAYRART